MGKKAREITLENREKVQELYFVQHFSMREIGKELGMSYQCVWHHVEKIRETLNKEFNTEPALQLIASHNAVMNKLHQEAWKIYDEAQYDVRSRIKILRSVAQWEMNNLYFMERIGVLDKIAQLLNNESNSIENSKDFREDMEWIKNLYMGKREERKSDN